MPSSSRNLCISLTLYSASALVDDLPSWALEDDGLDTLSLIQLRAKQTLPAGCELIKSNVECRSSDTRLPDTASSHQCAESVMQNGGVRFIFGKGRQDHRCYIESTTSDECTEGFVWSSYDFYSCHSIAEAGCNLVRADTQCSSADSRMPDADSLRQCAESVMESYGERFIYGKGGKSRQCFIERTESDECLEGWSPDDQFDFYSCADDDCSVVKRDAQCRYGEDRVDDADSWQECSALVRQRGGVRFIYGKLGKSRQCFMERTSSDQCTDAGGFVDKGGEFDFYSCDYYGL